MDSVSLALYSLSGPYVHVPAQARHDVAISFSLCYAHLQLRAPEAEIRKTWKTAASAIEALQSWHKPQNTDIVLGLSPDTETNVDSNLRCSEKAKKRKNPASRTV